MSVSSESVVLITGASSGIGRALAIELAKKRCRLVLSGRDRQQLDVTAERCAGATTHVVTADVTVREQCRALVEQAVGQFGRLDVLVNNAGSAMWSRFDALKDLDPIEEVMRVNYLGSVHCTYYALEHLKRSRGLVVAMTSIAGLLSPPMLSGYAASKHAMIGFFEALRIELAADGVGVTIVAPDFVQSEILARALGPSGRPLGASPIDTRKHQRVDGCARRIAKAIDRRERLVLTSQRSAWARWGLLLAPRLTDWIAGRAVANR